jgi:hypothetical protein
MPAKINHFAVFKWESLASTWRVLKKLWALLSSSLKTVDVMSIRNFCNTSVKNIPLKNGELPQVPRLESGETVFFYGPKFTDGSLSVYQTGKYAVVILSLNPPADSEAILLEMWNLLESLDSSAVFVGEELELYHHHIEAVRTGRLTPLALPLCEMAIVGTKDSDGIINGGSHEIRSAAGARGIFFRKQR